MVIGIFGESCTGKSTLAEALRQRLHARIFTGKDYLRLAKNESQAQAVFEQTLTDAMTGSHILYVISQRAHLLFLPDGAIRVLVTADLDTIKERFARRMGGNLPATVEAMLERNHGIFDAEPHHIHVRAGERETEETVEAILKLIG